MFGLYCRLGVHIYAPDTAVIRAVRKRFKPSIRRSRAHRDNRHKVYRLMLEYHHSEREFARQFRL